MNVLEFVLLHSLVQKMPDFGISGEEFENNLFTFEIMVLNFLQLQNFKQEKNA